MDNFLDINSRLDDEGSDEGLSLTAKLSYLFHSVNHSWKFSMVRFVLIYNCIYFFPGANISRHLVTHKTLLIFHLINATKILNLVINRFSIANRKIC